MPPFVDSVVARCALRVALDRRMPYVSFRSRCTASARCASRPCGRPAAPNRPGSRRSVFAAAGFSRVRRLVPSLRLVGNPKFVTVTFCAGCWMMPERSGLCRSVAGVGLVGATMAVRDRRSAVAQPRRAIRIGLRGVRRGTRSAGMRIVTRLPSFAGTPGDGSNCHSDVIELGTGATHPVCTATLVPVHEGRRRRRSWPARYCRARRWPPPLASSAASSSRSRVTRCSSGAHPS